MSRYALPDDQRELQHELEELYLLAKEKEQSSTALSILKYVQEKNEKKRSTQQAAFADNPDKDALLNKGDFEPQQDFMDRQYDEQQLDQLIFRALAALYADTEPELAALAQGLCNTEL